MAQEATENVGVPTALYSRPPLELAVGPIFAEEEILRLWWRECPGTAARTSWQDYFTRLVGLVQGLASR